MRIRIPDIRLRRRPCIDRHVDGLADWYCTRPKGHGGRHLAGGRADGERYALAVWGEDVHADARRRGREKITALANSRIFDVVSLIEQGADPDHAWAAVESIAGIEPTC